MGLPLNQLQSGLRQAMQPPQAHAWPVPEPKAAPEPKQTVHVVNPGPGPDTGTALSGHTNEVIDRQFREFHMLMVSARRNVARVGMANNQQHIVTFDAMDHPSTLDGPLLSDSRRL